MIEIFHYEFIRNAIISLCIASVISGVIGTYIVSKRIVLISGGIAHSSFGGVGLGILLGINPFLAAVPFSIISAMLIGLIGMRSKQDEEVAIALLWTLGMSLGILFLNLTSGYVTDILSYLFGSLITVSNQEILMMSFTALSVLLISFLFHREFESISFDEEYAYLSGIPVMLFNLLLLSLVALSVVVLMKSIGILLMIATLSVPPSIARKLTYDLREMMMLSSLIALNISLFGFFISYFLSVSPSVIIVLILSISFLLLYLWENFL